MDVVAATVLGKCPAGQVGGFVKMCVEVARKEVGPASSRMESSFNLELESGLEREQSKMEGELESTIAHSSRCKFRLLNTL